MNNLLSGGDDFDYQCHSNLVRAVLPFGLTEMDVHDVLNVFQVTGLNKDGKYFMSVITSFWPQSHIDETSGNLHQLSLLTTSRFSLKQTFCVLCLLVPVGI